MRYIELKEGLKNFTIFSLNDIKSIGKDFFRTRLTEWQKKGYIKKVVKGYYIFSDLELNENVLFEIANKIYSPSYISFEMALSYYHLIPESVYGIISASTRRTYRFKTKIGEFTYRTIKPGLFFGYKIVKYNNRSFKIAVPEKAVLDYFYINSDIETKSDFSNLRIDRDSFLRQIAEDKLFSFLEKFEKEAMSRRIKALWEFMKNA